MPTTDPVMAIADRVPLSREAATEAASDAPSRGVALFGLRFAVDPVTPSDTHKKTYYTVTVQEATQISKDGTVVTVTDQVQRERED